ncbi:hypothetical protein [Halolamina salifodinae]|uniref:Uncharacterized protein n=1 Tax=Halolamina salifodinae TaxID=1202767 RepID=A0A8T4GZ44_9EURY|nr:hypothetical protein [Halolamina salifodinae]MBP1987562.1 hypothetical protein [Halolamina salifodinae]
MEPRDEADVLLFGRNPALSAQFARLAGGLFVLSLLAYLPVRYIGSVSPTDGAVTTVLALAMVTVAAVAAYSNDGLLPAVALAAGVGVGFYAPAILFELRNPGEAALWILAGGSLSSLMFGALGFAIGAGAWRLRS